MLAIFGIYGEKLYDLLIPRSKRLYEDSLRAYNEKFYDLALVYLEQALQLFLKAKVGGDDILIINLLGDVYIERIYLEKEYSEKEHKKALDMDLELIEIKKLKKAKEDLNKNIDKYLKKLKI